MLKVTIVMYRATGCAVMCRAVLNSNVSCRVELCCALLHCGSSRPWRQNPDRTDLDLKLELPERRARATCSRNARSTRPTRAQDQIQFRSPRSRHPHNVAPRTDGPKRGDPRRDKLHQDDKRYEPRRRPNRPDSKRDKTKQDWEEPNTLRLTILKLHGVS